MAKHVKIAIKLNVTLQYNIEFVGGYSTTNWFSVKVFQVQICNQVQDCNSMSLCGSKEQYCLPLHSYVIIMQKCP